MSLDMKVPSRPAPPRPGSQNNKKTQNSYTVDLLTLGKDPFGSQPTKSNVDFNKLVGKKKPPPRPPPPKYKGTTNNKGPSQILEIFGRNKEKTRNKAAATAIVKPLPPVTGVNTTVDSLIDLHSPSSSPTFTKSVSSLSIQSLGSNGYSQPIISSNIESGFEDDFGSYITSNATTPSNDPFSDSSDPFSPTTTKVLNQAVFELSNVDPKAKLQSRSNFHTTTTIPNISRPTIIRVKNKPSRPPPPKSKQDVPKGFVSVNTSAQYGYRTPVKNEDNFGSSCESWSSPPMPTVPPPPPPPEVVHTLLNGPPVPTRPSSSAHTIQTNSATKTPYCKAEYDYEATHPEDLSFRAGDIITLTGRENSDWLKGRLNGKEGIFPENYVNIVIPLDNVETNSLNMTVIALFPFTAETWDDLDFEEGDEISVLHRVNEDWLYGECGGKRGQFPENFVQDITPFIGES